MPSRDVNAATRLDEASWRRDKELKYICMYIYVPFGLDIECFQARCGAACLDVDAPFIFINISHVLIQGGRYLL